MNLQLAIGFTKVEVLNEIFLDLRVFGNGSGTVAHILGAIYTKVAITLNDCNFTNNTASESNDIYNTSTLTYSNLVFINDYVNMDSVMVKGYESVVFDIGPSIP